MIKNLTSFQLQEFSLSASELADKLEARPLIAPSALSVASYGWVPVAPDGRLVQQVGDHLLLMMGAEEKILPASAIKRELAIKVQAFSDEKGFPPGKKAVRDLKDAVTSELLSKALIKNRSVLVWIDLAASRITVDAPSTKKAEDVLSLLRDTLGSLKVYPVVTLKSPMTCMTEWLTHEVPAPFSIGNTLELVAPDSSKNKVKFTEHVIESCPEVASHLRQGMRASQIELFLDDQAQFKVNEKLQVKGVKLFVGDDGGGDSENDDPQERFEADALLSFSILSRIMEGLIEQFGGVDAEAAESIADADAEADDDDGDDSNS